MQFLLETVTHTHTHTSLKPMCKRTKLFNFQWSKKVIWVIKEKQFQYFPDDFGLDMIGQWRDRWCNTVKHQGEGWHVQVHLYSRLRHTDVAKAPFISQRCLVLGTTAFVLGHVGGLFRCKFSTTTTSVQKDSLWCDYAATCDKAFTQYMSCSDKTIFTQSLYNK